MNHEKYSEDSLEIKKNAYEIFRNSGVFDAVKDLISEARIVLLIESSHSAQDFYHERAVTTKRLITENSFNAIAIEVNWSDACKVNQYLKRVSHGSSAIKSLEGFKRFSSWMRCNKEVLSLVNWLYQCNQLLKSDKQMGFYGLDLYNLNAALAPVIVYLKKIGLEAAKRTVNRYACFDQFEIDPQNYTYASAISL